MPSKMDGQPHMIWDWHVSISTVVVAAHVAVVGLIVHLLRLCCPYQLQFSVSTFKLSWNSTPFAKSLMPIRNFSSRVWPLSWSLNVNLNLSYRNISNNFHLILINFVAWTWGFSYSAWLQMWAMCGFRYTNLHQLVDCHIESSPTIFTNFDKIS